MWLMLGVITLLGSLLLGWKLRRDAAWKGALEYQGEFAFVRTYQASKRKNKKQSTPPNDWRYGVRAAGKPEFRLKRQSLLDAVFQKLGISNEVQTGDQAFDRAVYVVSDHPDVRAALQRDPELRRRVVALFAGLQAQSYQLREVRLAGERLWVHARSKVEFRNTVLEPVRTWLYDIIERLPETRGERRFDPYVLRAAAVLTLSTGLAISGALMLFGLVGRYPSLLDTGPLWTASFLASVPLLVTLVLGSLIMLGRSARSHLILVELLLVGAFGVWSWTFFGLREANWRLDVTPPQPVELRLAEKAHWTTTSRSRKGGRRTTHHYELRFDKPLVLPGRDALAHDRHTLSVNSSEFSAAHQGATWVFVLRQGRLGWPWVASGQELSPGPGEVQ